MAQACGRQILIYGINYEPEVTGIAPYTTGLAQHLESRGHRVTVATGMPHYPEWRVYGGYRKRLRQRETLGGVEVRRFIHYVPSRQSALGRGLYEATFLAHGVLAFSLPRPDVVLGVVPSLSGGALAAMAARRYGAPFGLIVQDLMGQAAAQSGVTGGSRVARLTAALEGSIMRRADGIAVIAEGFRRHLDAMGVEPSRIRRVRNWAHVGQAVRSREAVRTSLGLPTSATICLHAGNMGFKQGLENVVEAARQANSSDPSLLFVLMGDGNQRAYLQELAASLPNVRFLPAQAEDDFPDVLGAADVLLVNQRPTVLDMSLPGKLTSYFSSGRPVVAAVSPQSETAVEIAAAGAGTVVGAGAPDRLLAAIRGVVDDPTLAARLGEQGRTYAQTHLTAEAALARLEEFVLGIEGPARGGIAAGRAPERVTTE